MPIFILNNPQAKANAIRMINEASFEAPLEITILPYKKKRTSSQNSLLWASLVGDFVDQGIINGRQFDAKTWHEFLKEQFLPATHIPGKTLRDYKKYIEMPDGKLRMVGSTTDLTTSGMTDYLENCYSWGSQELGIRFLTNKYE